MLLVGEHPFGVLNKQEIRQIAARLREARMALEPNQSEFAKGAGMSQHRYNQYETGARPLTLDAAMRLHKRYGLSLDWLFRGDTAFLPNAFAQKLQAARDNPPPK
jgi:transcriptional regulator with XRE-family HTH domain